MILNLASGGHERDVDVTIAPAMPSLSQVPGAQRLGSLTFNKTPPIPLTSCAGSRCVRVAAGRRTVRRRSRPCRHRPGSVQKVRQRRATRGQRFALTSTGRRRPAFRDRRFAMDMGIDLERRREVEEPLGGGHAPARPADPLDARAGVDRPALIKDHLAGGALRDLVLVSVDRPLSRAGRSPRRAASSRGSPRRARRWRTACRARWPARRTCSAARAGR